MVGTSSREALSLEKNPEDSSGASNDTTTSAGGVSNDDALIVR